MYFNTQDLRESFILLFHPKWRDFQKFQQLNLRE